MIANVPPCTFATARAAIVQTHVHAKLNGDTVARIDPASADHFFCAGGTLAVTIASGGTAGDIGFILFRRTPAGWKVGVVRSGYKLGLIQAGTDVIWSQPVYRKNDPNCCPTGGFDDVRYHWNGARFAVVRSYHTKVFPP